MTVLSSGLLTPAVWGKTIATVAQVCQLLIVPVGALGVRQSVEAFASQDTPSLTRNIDRIVSLGRGPALPRSLRATPVNPDAVPYPSLPGGCR